VSAVDDAIAELKKAEALLAAAKAVDASTLPRVELVSPSEVARSTPADGPVLAPVAVAEAKRGPMIKNGKLFASVR
jgi:hypothetical protein